MTAKVAVIVIAPPDSQPQVVPDVPDVFQKNGLEISFGVRAVIFDVRHVLHRRKGGAVRQVVLVGFDMPKPTDINVSISFGTVKIFKRLTAISPFSMVFRTLPVWSALLADAILSVFTESIFTVVPPATNSLFWYYFPFLTPMAAGVKAWFLWMCR